MANKVYYIGDVFGYREGSKLILGQSYDERWPFDFNGSSAKPYVPLQDNFAIEWFRDQTSGDNKRPQNIRRRLHVDRPLLEGVKVRHGGHRGIVKAERKVATVKLMNDSSCIEKVSLERLKKISEPVTGRHVLYKGYIGVIESVTHKVKMDFLNGAMCKIDYEKDNDVYNGASITPTFQDLKRASWCGGGFNIASLRILQNIACTARVSDINVESVKVNWSDPLPPSPPSTREIPATILTQNQISNVKYLPGDCGIEPNSVWELQITHDDLEHIFDTEGKWLDKLFDENLNPDEDDENTPAKQQKLELGVLQIGSVQPVKILLVQSLVQIEYYEMANPDEIESCKLDEILMKNSIEIPKIEYVTKIDRTDHLTFGVDRQYFAGEGEQTPMDPTLNPSNTKNIQWFRVNDNDPEQIEPIELEEVSVFDLQTLRLNTVLGSCSYLTRAKANDEFTVGSFSRILDNGMIEIKDLDGNMFQRWPTQVSVRKAENPHYLTNIFEAPPVPNTDQFLKTNPKDLGQIHKAVSVPLAPFFRPTFKPNNPTAFAQGRKKDLDTVLDTNNPLLHGKWIQAFGDREDLFTALMLGRPGTILENLVFLIEIQLPPTYPNESPVFTLNPCSNLGRTQLWDWLTDGSFGKLDERTLLGGLDSLLDSIETVEINVMKPDPVDNWVPTTYFYPVEFTNEGERRNWQKRWNEALAVQAVRYVYNSIAYPSLIYYEHILGHYRYHLPAMMDGWNSWIRNESNLFSEVSPGFVLAIKNQLRRFESFLATNIVQELVVGKAKDSDQDSSEGDKKGKLDGETDLTESWTDNSKPGTSNSRDEGEAEQSKF